MPCVFSRPVFSVVSFGFFSVNWGMSNLVLHDGGTANLRESENDAVDIGAVALPGSRTSVGEIFHGQNPEPLFDETGDLPCHYDLPQRASLSDDEPLDFAGGPSLFGAFDSAFQSDLHDTLDPQQSLAGDVEDWDSANVHFERGPGPSTGFVATDVCNAFENPGPTISRSTQEALFSRALLTNCQTTDILLPWETGFYKEFFSDDLFSQIVPKMPVTDLCSFDDASEPQVVAKTLASVAHDSNPNPVFSRFVVCKDDGPYAEKQKQLREVAINKFLVVLKHDLSCSVTGRHILELGDTLQQDLGAHAVVEAVLGIRSPATLVKRANSLLSYLRWFAKTVGDFNNPFTEAFIWDYLQHLKFVDAPATRGDSAMSAFRFGFHILGIDTLGPALNSRRLIGTCEIMLSKKRLLRQALVLTVAQVKGLHIALSNESLHVMDRAVVAYLLFALYGRCRNSDLLMIHSIEKDFNEAGGFVIVRTSHHKTGRMAALKTRLMPIVIPARGVDGSIWVEKALNVLEAAGAAPDSPGEGPLLRAPAGEKFAFMERGLKASEVSCMLRKFVGAPEPVPGSQEPAVSSHSLKATTLSWCARFGTSPASRSLLGRHTSCLNETFAIYSRDLVCAPVVELQGVIDSICDGTFSPDCQRSEFFQHDSTLPQQSSAQAGGDDEFEGVEDPPTGEVESAMSELHECAGGDVGLDAEVVTDVPPCGANVEVAGPAGVVDTDSSDSSSSSSVGSSSSDSENNEPTPRVKRFRAKIPEEQVWFVHSKSTLVHRFDGDTHNSVKYLVCGKRLTSAYEPCAEATAWNVLCKTCNKR